MIINFGLYGLPSYSAPLKEITRKLEQKTRDLDGRKALYSRSYYTEEEFWEIYSRESYELLMRQSSAQGVWQGIIEKVLSE
jgi:hypothetical protein